MDNKIYFKEYLTEPGNNILYKIYKIEETDVAEYSNSDYVDHYDKIIYDLMECIKINRDRVILPEYIRLYKMAEYIGKEDEITDFIKKNNKNFRAGYLSNGSTKEQFTTAYVFIQRYKKYF